ncbi:phage tail tape measure protein [Dysgonomonas sp. 520]|uniref:phage tail tape measure protein n=1 Tax=Dysgonomonas sp. 520 TaxID=2302931 RepID=UPI0013D36B40|nr:phage tail tape measure protein [Dysgonomonas sp. 520]NDW10434.1 phage tail tape measure protein [Dysgonomonas sp. 520]
MASGQSRIELILELSNRLGTGLNQARSQIRSEIGGFQGRVSEYASRIRNDLSSVTNDLPIIGGRLGSLMNPTMAIVGGIGLITTGLIKATDRAAEFNSEFRDLANLNLSKSQEEIDDLRRMVLNSAWKKGFNAEKTSNAYNELQSTVGLYGMDAQPIVEKQGEFALLMKTSMDEYVAGTAKAMANWRFGVDKLDDYNKSNYAAMQVGVVSFAELAKVQSVFAGSAASINQSFDTANKLFSIFTVKTKSVDEAATLTKSLFNDLTKTQTIKAFKSIGIDVFDANKKLKQADVILLELNKKFQRLNNDKAIVNLKNKFKGSEGLLAMIQAATDRTGELKNMMNEFQDSKFNADMALSQAHNDIMYRQEQLSNRVDTLIIRVGQMLLPFKEKIIGVAEGIVNGLEQFTKSSKDKQSESRNKSYADIHGAYSLYMEDATTISKEVLESRLDYLWKRSNEEKKKYNDFTNEYKDAGFLKTNSFSYFLGTDSKVEMFDENNGYERWEALGRSEAFRDVAKQIEKAWYNRGENDPKLNNKTDTSDSGTGDSDKITGDLNRVVGSAQAPRNITVNIDSFNKGGINTQNTSLQQMDSSQIEEWFIDVCMRAVRNVEMAYY